MKFKIIHETRYNFNDEVFFEPHSLRFKPKNTPHIELDDFRLKLIPKPIGISEYMDVENNFVHLIWFEEMHSALTINAEVSVESKEFNPFNFLIHPIEYSSFPFTYSGAQTELLNASLNASAIGIPLLEFGNNILSASQNKTLDFLSNLTRAIHKEFHIYIRETGSPLMPDHTFDQKNGSCRDLAWMQIHLLRHLGMAARFVSGYFYLPMVDGDQFELHAWLEVFLPGAGWIGFDPSHGIVAGQHHIPIASSAHYENAMSVSGSIRGSASSEMKTKLEIRIVKP